MVSATDLFILRLAAGRSACLAETLIDALAESWDVERDATTRSTGAEASFGFDPRPCCRRGRGRDPCSSGRGHRLDDIRAKGGRPRTGGTGRPCLDAPGTRCR